MDLPISLEKAVVARLRISNQKFEILVDPYKALEFRRGKEIDLNDILAVPEIFRDARTTERVSAEELQKTFGTTDIFEIAKRILRKGEIQLTTEQRREMVKMKKQQIATIISKRGVNPQTNTPHPPQRILKAMEDLGVNVDPFLDAELQVDKVLKEIRKLLPISFQKVLLRLKIPPEYAGKAYSVLRRGGNVINEKWLDDGSLEVTLEVLAGVQQELFDKISSLTHGNFESKILERREI